MSAKGQRDGLCNRTSCQAPLPDEKGQFYNTSTRAWYCSICAKKINFWSVNDDKVILCISETEYDMSEGQNG